VLPIDLHTLASLCGGAWRASRGEGPLIPMELAMLAAGAVSGVTHCAAMCGPIVLAQVASVPPRSTGCGRIAAGIRAPYHFGRIATYVALGAAAGAIGQTIVRSIAAEAAPIGLGLAIAALVVACLALRNRSTGLGRFGRWIAFLSRPLLSGGFVSGLGLGLVLGLLPCGVVYAALSVAAAGANPTNGALLMLAFGLGTLPGLVAIGTVGRAIGNRLGLKLAPFALALNALALGMLALRAWMAG
jgi:sulfite exporter TauE/SafE